MASSSSNNADAAASGASDVWSNWNNATAAASGASDAWSSNWNNNAAAAASGASSEPEDASNNATAAASSGAPPDADAELLDRVVAVISSRRKYNAGLTWKRLLAGHTHRGKNNGGHIIDEFVDQYMTYVQIDTEDTIRATLEIPHSFQRGDNAACGATVTAGSKDDGVQLASKNVLAKLFIRDATDHYPYSQLTLHAKNWKCERADLLQEVRNVVVGSPPPHSFYSAPPQPPLPMPTTTRRQAAGGDLYEPPADPAERVEEIKAVLRQMIDTDGGSTKPHYARKIWTADGNWQQPYTILARLVVPGKLREFLDTDGSDEFEYTTKPAKKDGEQVLDTIKYRDRSGGWWQPAAPHTGSQRWSVAASGGAASGGAAAGQPAAPAAQWYTTGE